MRPLETDVQIHSTYKNRHNNLLFIIRTYIHEISFLCFFWQSARNTDATMKTYICLVLVALLTLPQVAAVITCPWVKSEFKECIDDDSACPNSVRFNLWRCLGPKCALAENCFYWQNCYQLGTDNWKCEMLLRKVQRACFLWDKWNSFS